MKRTIRLFLFGLLGISQAALSQAPIAFAKKYNPSLSGAFQDQLVTSDSMLVACGWVNTGVDGYVCALDDNGDTLWTRVVDDPSGCMLTCLSETSDKALIVAGHGNSYGSGDEDITLLKINRQGKCLWRQVYGSANYESASQVICTSDKGFLIAGSMADVTHSSYNYVYLVKTDSVGNQLWTKTIHGSVNDLVSAVQELPNHDLLLAGSTSQANRDVFLMRLSSTGNILWSYRYGASGIELGNDLQIDQLGNIYVCGMANPSGALLMKTDTAGSVLWAKAYVSNGDQSAEAMSFDKSSHLAVGGWRRLPFSGGTESACLLMKVDLNGDTSFTRVLDVDSLADEVAYAVHDHYDGSYLLPSGVGSGFATSYRQLQIKTDPQGLIPCGMVSPSIQVNNYTMPRNTFSCVITSSGTASSVGLAQKTLGTQSLICTTCLTPASPTDATTGTLVCPTGPATLSVTGIGGISWYDSATSTSVIGTGNNFVTPTFSPGVYTFFAEARTCMASARTPVTYTVSQCLGLEGSSALSHMTIFPDPIHEKATVVFDEVVQSGELIIYGISGQVVRSLSISAQKQIEISREGLPAGIYTVALICKGSQPRYAKVAVGN